MIVLFCGVVFEVVNIELFGKFFGKKLVKNGIFVEREIFYNYLKL